MTSFRDRLNLSEKDRRIYLTYREQKEIEWYEYAHGIDIQREQEKNETRVRKAENKAANKTKNHIKIIQTEKDSNTTNFSDKNLWILWRDDSCVHVRMDINKDFRSFPPSQLQYAARKALKKNPAEATVVNCALYSTIVNINNRSHCKVYQITVRGYKYKYGPYPEVRTSVVSNPFF